MKLVRSRDLTAYDVPRIESPFFAAGTVRHLLRTRHDFRREILDILNRAPFDRSDSDLENAVKAEVREGEILLIHEWLDGAPFSPVVTWQPDESLSAGGKWRLNESVWGVPLEHTVADLNEWGITPDQLRDSIPGGIGHLPASMFGCEMGIRRGECERRLGLMLGGSYVNTPSNVARLWDLYAEEEVESDGVAIYRYPVYAPGAGTKTGSGDSLYDAATGLGDTGVIQQVSYALSRLALQAKEGLQGKVIDRLTIDLFGFSRGAAAARHAANEINLGQDGRLAQALEENGVAWPYEVRIRFVGLFDTVAGIANITTGDLVPHNDRNGPLKLYLDPSRIDHTVHLTAIHEHRKNFALNSLRSPDGTLPDNFREIALPGAHSDIGGGYGDSQREEVLISPLLPVPLNRLRWPEKTMVWDNLEELRKQVAAEGWIGPYNLPVQQSDKLHASPRDLGPEGKASLEIFTHREAHPAPDGQVELALRMVRQVRGEYSLISMRLMHQLAVDYGVPLKKIPDREEMRLPTELSPIYSQLSEHISNGEDAPSLSTEHQDLLLQRYIHYSANYNSFETSIGGLPVRVRLFRHLRPHAPVSSRERLVYPQQEGK